MKTKQLFQYSPQSGTQKARPRINLTFVILICIFSLFLSSFSQRALAAGKTATTVYLPLKINSPTDSAELARLSDDILSESAKDTEADFLPREQIQSYFDYSEWPPKQESFQGSDLTDQYDYVVAGSLTQTGSLLSIDLVVYDLLDASAQKYYFSEAREKTALHGKVEDLCKKIAAHTNRYIIVSSLSIKGNKKIDSGAIMQRIPLAKGDIFERDKVRSAIAEIFKMGYFNDIQVYSETGEEGRQLTFEVFEKAVIGQITIDGEKELETDEIREVILLVPNNIISSRDVQDSVASIKTLYKDKGFYNTKVSAELSYPSEGRVDVRFKILEGPKVFIKEITVTGNEAFKTKELTKVLETSERNWLSWITDSGVLNAELVEQDTSRLAAYYHNKGYIEAKVSKPEITQKGKWIYINFNVFEGDRYRVGTVDLEGDLIINKAELMSQLAIMHEPYFSRQTLRDDVLRLTDKYAENGYAFADLNPVTDKDSLNKRVNVTIHVSKNELVHINRIIIKGNSRTRDKVVRREMQIKETGIFNATALKQSNERLKRLEYFEEVNISPQPTGQTGLMDVVVQVKEKATGSFSIGAGYSSVDSFMLMAEISQNNFLGKGQRLSVQANLSKNNNQYNFSFTEPHLADSNLLFGFDLYDLEREYDDYTRDSQGLGIRVGHPLWDKWQMSASYTFDDTNLTDLAVNASRTIRESAEINVTSSLRFGLFRDTRDRFTDPSRGSSFKSALIYAGGFLGGDSEFTKVEGTYNFYHPLPYKTTFHYRLAAGQAFDNSGNKLPIFEKYYLGGINNVRGFKSGNISPRDPITLEKIGGDKMWYYNLEWIFPLVEDAGLKGLIFFDAGNVYDENESWDFGDIKRSVGLGFRWLSPMGPLRLEWGYNLDPTIFEVQDNWDFSIGGSF